MKLLNSIITTATFAVVLTVSAQFASAQVIAVPNASFEAPGSSSDQLTNQTGGVVTLIQDWMISSNSDGEFGLAYSPGSSTYDGITGTTGSQVVVLQPYYGYHFAILTSGNSTNNDGTPAGSTGFLSVVAPNATYNLTADVGIPTGQSVDEDAGYEGTFHLQLVDSSGNIFAENIVNENTLSVGSLTTLSLNYISGATPADLGDSLKIQFFLNNGSNDSHSAVEIDNVTLNAPAIAAPEPSTYAMLMAGAAALAFFVRRRTA